VLRDTTNISPMIPPYPRSITDNLLACSQSVADLKGAAFEDYGSNLQIKKAITHFSIKY